MSYPLPREISPGVFWLGDCLVQHSQGKIYHSYNAAFLVIGSEASMLVETGHPKDFPIIERQMRDILARGGGPLKHLFLTHQETPHSGGLGRVLDRYPDLTIHGDMVRLPPRVPPARGPLPRDARGRHYRLGRYEIHGRGTRDQGLEEFSLGVRDQRAGAVSRRRLRLQPLPYRRTLRDVRRGGHLSRSGRRASAFSPSAPCSGPPSPT